MKRLLLSLCCAGCAATQTAEVNDLAPAVRSPEAAYLDRFVGRWLGSGESHGKVVRDEMVFRRALGNRFLAMTYRAIEGDDYVGEGYLWWNPARQRYELYEFNNGAWPIRFETGHKTGQTLLLEERADGRQVRLRFEFTGADRIEMTESTVQQGGEKVFVRLRFRRQATP